MRRGLAVAMLGIALLATACQTGSSAPPAARQTAAGESSLWVAIDLPGTYSGDRAAAYDPSRNCLWIATRIWAEFAGDTEHATLTRLNLADHSVVQTGLRLPATGWEGAWVLVDDHDRVWMAWGRTVFSYDPASATLTKFGFPGFAQLGLHPSFYSGDGNLITLGRDSTGELWAAFSRVAAIIGFNPSLGKWDRVIKLPWFPSGVSSPRPGVLVISGGRTPDDKQFFFKLAELDLASQSIREYDAGPGTYTVADPHTMVFVDASGNLGRLDLDTGDVTILDGPSLINTIGSPFGIRGDGYAWYSIGTGVARVDIATGVMTRYQFPAVVPTSPVPNICLDHSGFGPCVLPCPSGVTSCVPKPWIPAAQIYALTFDAHGNIWLVTDQAGTQRPSSLGREPLPTGPVMELRIGS